MASRKILVIEDDRPLSEIISYNLKQHGFQVTTAFDGQSGLSAVLHQPPEIILLDVMLPVLDGIEVCRRLRSSGDEPMRHPDVDRQSRRSRSVAWLFGRRR